MSRVSLPPHSTSARRSGEDASPANVSAGVPGSIDDARQLQRAELLKRFGASESGDGSLREPRTIAYSAEPVMKALKDDARALQMIERASSPYHNPRTRVRGLSLDATACNCLLETSSSEIFENLTPMHADILTRCSTKSAAFSAKDYSIAPYALKPGRERGDLFLAELTRSDLSYKAVNIPGSAPRFLNVGADAPYGFLLMHKDTPIAAVSYVVAEGPTLFVVMTQRVRQHGVSSEEIAEAKMHEKAAKRLHLKEAMLSLCSSIAETLGCASITYQGALNNRWVHEMVAKGGDDGWNTVCVPRMKFEDAQATYDTFCEAHGFTRDPQSGNFVKALSRSGAR